jgi:AcrR family transcriptional regulator
MAVRRRVARGRPRDPATDAAILRAASELFTEGGIEDATIERIAKRACVARTTIYRRWSNREELLVEAIEHTRPAFLRLGGGLENVLPEDLATFGLKAGIDLLTRSRFRRAAVRLIAALPNHPRLFRSFRQHQLLPRRAVIRSVLERARAGGALPVNSDLEILMDVFSGFLLYQLLFRPENQNPERLRPYVMRLFRQLGFTVRDAGKSRRSSSANPAMSARQEA